MVAKFDSSIFMNGANARIQDRNNMMNTLSRLAYGMQEQKARRDEIRRREAKDAAEQARNPMNALIKMKQGGWDSLSVEEQAVLQAQDTMRTSEIGMNQWGQTYQKNNSILPNQTQGIVPQKSTYDTLAGPAPSSPNGQVVGAPSGGLFSTLAGPEPTYSNPESNNPMAATPAGQMEAYKNELDMQRDIIMNDREAERDRQAEAGKEKITIENQAAQLDSLDEEIDMAIEQTDMASAGAASFTGIVGGTPAANLEARLNTITSDAALGRLAELKKEGGTLGAVSEKELALLGSAITGLDQSQSPEQLKFNLKKYKRVRRESFDRVEKAYKEKYGVDLNLQGTSPKNPEQVPKAAIPITERSDAELMEMLNGL